ncbi:hypothetical protein A0J57_18855 [Sphingobium sp. 22B]|uniref:aminotransferase class V-fold PLP-dependent enzyme n=1 Tax=unclassified Sphingobium TaxID=2611147 RepID=UPI000780C8B4|nr:MULTISPECIES: aminotransferase class V-fold PLP-dependent enzyme [unclassified Sphingobium]KXU30499.1 hypothetical protein AXW74_17460 [Sphingobium sp. AM]KYC30758.1 hypothetical protein A0J57_18855 [Sphingobium sp. 22B]OAP30056.1 hypothetical protein A8O16_20440 [Sphingobium sp. 20006FA]
MTEIAPRDVFRHPLPPVSALPPMIKIEAFGLMAFAGAQFATDRAQFAPPAEGADAAYWERIRSQFDFVNGLTFLNNGTYCPPPRLVLETQKRWQRHLASHPQDHDRQDLLEQVRAKAAAFVNADVDEIALTRSTTEGLNLLAQGLDWREGDEIVLERGDHFASFQSFLTLTGRYGVKLVFVDLGPEPGSPEEIVAAYAAAITPRTRWLVMNWVNYRTGWQMPVKALAELGRSHGLMVSVDAAQAFGAIRIDVAELGIDHLAAPSHKWILGGSGAGFTYFSKRILDRVASTSGPEWLPGTPPAWRHSARKFDRQGPANIATEMGFLEALEFHDVIGGELFRGRLRQLSERLRTGLREIAWGRVVTPDAPEQSSALTAFLCGERSADDVERQLLDRFRIKVNSEAFVGLNVIRVSPHIYTSEAQIDYFIEAMKAL